MAESLIGPRNYGPSNFSLADELERVRTNTDIRLDALEALSPIETGDAAGGSLTGTYPDPTIIADCPLTTPKITTGIKDSAGNTIVGFTPTGSAANYHTFQNNTAGGAPRAGVAGTDTDIDYPIQTKGAGLVKARYSGVNYEVETVRTYDAKGDIVVGTADNARGVLAAGTNGQSLVSDSAETTGRKNVWRPHEIPFHVGVTANATQTLLGAAVEFLLASSRHVSFFDLTDYSQIRVCINKIGTAGSAGSFLGVYYRTAFSATASDYSVIGTGNVEVPIDTSAGAQVSSWVDLAAGAKADVCIAILLYGGSGLVSPQFGRIVVQVR